MRAKVFPPRAGDLTTTMAEEMWVVMGVGISSVMLRLSPRCHSGGGTFARVCVVVSAVRTQTGPCIDVSGRLQHSPPAGPHGVGRVAVRRTRPPCE